MFRKPYENKRTRVSLAFLDEDGNQAIGRTKQSLKNETDINVILRNYDKTGLITHVSKATAEYGDFTEVNEYQENLNMVIKAENSFLELPSALRKHFNNDAGQFFEFATDPKNAEKLMDMGLANRPIPVQPINVNIVDKPSTDNAVDP